MPWPSLVDYIEAVRDYPHISILDPKLKGGTPCPGGTPNNDLLYYPGGFSIVFPIDMVSDTYALRCWHEDIGEAGTRYREIADYLVQCRLPYFVGFEYVPEGIMVADGTKYPTTRMEWVEWADGNNLCDFIKQNLRDTECLKTAAAAFQKMVVDLHDHQISHGDLQDGNILLKRNGTDVEIKLIDYDSLFVPALREQSGNTDGLPGFQHPQRKKPFGRDADYFSELVIYLSLLALAEKPDLWGQVGSPTSERLLFKAADFRNPDQSEIFREIKNLSPDVKHLASKLKEFCSPSVDQLGPLESVLPKNRSGTTFIEGVLASWERFTQKLFSGSQPVDPLEPSEPVSPPVPPREVLYSSFEGDVLGRWEQGSLNGQESPPTKTPGPNPANPPSQTPSSSPTNTRSRSHEPYNCADNHYKEKNWIAAENLARDAFELDSTSQPTRELLTKIMKGNYYRGINHWNDRQRDTAVFYFKRVIDTEFIFQEGNCGVEGSYIRQGLAVNAAQKVLEVDGTYQPARQLLAAIE